MGSIESLTRVYIDVQNKEQNKFVLVHKHELIVLGSRQLIIERLRDLWMEGDLSGTNYRILVDATRGR